jgi:hypothetical protein
MASTGIFKPGYSNNATPDLTQVPNPTVTSQYSQATLRTNKQVLESPMQAEKQGHCNLYLT